MSQQSQTSSSSSSTEQEYIITFDDFFSDEDSDFDLINNEQQNSASHNAEDFSSPNINDSDSLPSIVSNNEILQSICSSLRKNDRNLCEVNLSNSNIGDDEVYQLAKYLRYSNHVSKLVLYGNSIGPYGATALVESLLSTTPTRFSPQRQDAKRPPTTDRPPPVEFIDISNNNIGPQGAKEFGRLLRDYHEYKTATHATPTMTTSKTKTLKYLNLSNNQILDEGIQGLLEANESCSTLEVLYVTKNGITDKGVVGDGGVTHFLEKNQSLHYFFLLEDNPGISSMAYQQIGQSIFHNFSLKYIDTVHGYGTIACIRTTRTKDYIDFFIKFNKTGRRSILRDDHSPIALWANVLAKVGGGSGANYQVPRQLLGTYCSTARSATNRNVSTTSASRIFYFLQCKPELFDHHRVNNQI